VRDIRPSLCRLRRPENQAAQCYLRQRQSDLFAEFETIVETVSLEQQQFSLTN
jgi:hypothetical protein